MYGKISKNTQNFFWKQYFKIYTIYVNFNKWLFFLNWQMKKWQKTRITNEKYRNLFELLRLKYVG